MSQPDYMPALTGHLTWLMLNSNRVLKRPLTPQEALESSLHNPRFAGITEAAWRYALERAKLNIRITQRIRDAGYGQWTAPGGNGGSAQPGS